MKIPTEKEIQAAEDLIATADLEYKGRAVIDMISGCACSVYLRNNYRRILPKLVIASLDNNEDIAVTVKRYTDGVHKRHLEGKPLS